MTEEQNDKGLKGVAKRVVNKHGGAVSGAVVGGVIGSILPGIGTAAGIIVGGFIGHWAHDEDR